MVETVAAAPATPAAVAASPKVAKKGKKAATPKAKKAAAPAHPKIAVMVNAAIGSLKERGGSSLQAIKKYIAANYKVDVERTSPFIKKYLKTAVEKGSLIQTKGKGATGSFRLGSGTKSVDVEKKPKTKKSAGRPKVAKKPAASLAKKTVEKKTKAKVVPKAKVAPKAKPTVVAKSPKKVRAAKPKKAKTPTKPKAPKAKKAKTPTKKAGAKK